LFKRTPLVIEIRDLWPESIATVGAIKKSNIFYKIILKLSNFLYKKAQVIICVTQSFKNDLINRNINKNKIFVIENGFNFNNSLLPKKTIYEIEKKYNINHNKFNVAFTGTVGLAHGLEIIINTAKLLRNINFYIIGEGAKKNELIKKAKELKINNIYFINNLSWQEIVDINQSIDMHLVHLIDSDEFKKVIPSKIFESMALKKPIILGVKGESEKIIDKARCGFKITPENEKEFAEVISNIINKKYLINDFGENGFNYLVRNNSRTILADKMIKSISKIISRN
jgi:glycosyltransferase involved in cell wall biosynthesis